MQRTTDEQLVEQRIISPDDFHDDIPRISEVARLDLDIPADLSDRLSRAAEHLLTPPGLLDDCIAALVAGNIVIQGPPGTGKSSLAHALADAFNAELLPVTAHEDWSTFEVIGRQELRVGQDGHEEIVPVNGHFTEAVIRCAGNIPRHQDDATTPQATWLLIDELNRAHPDRAFGELFSVLGTDDPVRVTLGYQRSGNDTLIMPRRFRIIATVNSVDRQFVNGLSQGLRRRFAFLTFDIPPKRQAAGGWGIGDSPANLEFTLVLQKGAERAARRLRTNPDRLLQQLTEVETRRHVETLFDLVERVRYADGADKYPYVPVGTASLIDTIELCLLRAGRDASNDELVAKAIDWACAMRIGPLFDAGGVNREKLHTFALDLEGPFAKATRRALLAIESDGMFYVADG